MMRIVVVLSLFCSIAQGATPPGYTDYCMSGPTLADAGAALAALQSAGLVGAGDVPANMLGDPQQITVGGSMVTIRARQGWAASSYTDPVTQQVVNVPGAGVAGAWYLDVRTVVPPAAVPFDPASLGLTPVDPATCAAVLGTWF